MKALKMAWAVLFVLMSGACGHDPEPGVVAQDEAPLTAIPIIEYTYGSQIRRSWLMLTADGTLRVHEQHCGGCSPVASVDTVSRRDMQQLRKHIALLAHAPQLTGCNAPATLGGRSGSLVARTQSGREVAVHRIESADPSPGETMRVTYASGAAAAAVRDFVNAQVAMPMPAVESTALP